MNRDCFMKISFSTVPALTPRRACSMEYDCNSDSTLSIPNKVVKSYSTDDAVLRSKGKSMPYFLFTPFSFSALYFLSLVHMYLSLTHMYHSYN